MPQREPARRQTAGEPPAATVTMRLDEHGRWVPVLPAEQPTPTTEATERPPTPDDPRGAFSGPDAG
jgi:hypothetical protein